MTVASRPAVALALAVSVAAVAAVAPPAGVAASGGAFALTQGDDCTPVTPLGDGSTTVSSFYGYRNATTTPQGLYSSYGTRDLQVHQASVLFLYDGSRGVSLVVLHDKLGDGEGGGAATFTFTGLPADGTWAVEDDSYPARDDNFTHEGSRSVVDWMWAPNRTDGAAFRGIDRDGVTVAPDFDATPMMKTSDGDWVEWRYADDPVERWLAYTGDGTVTLDRTRNVTVRRGPCDAAPPTAALSVRRADTDGTVVLDAGNATAEAGVERYRWDFDGDGSVDATTGEATVSHVYPVGGVYEATVTVVDSLGQNDTATATVDLTGRASLAVVDVSANASTVDAGAPVAVVATVENDGTRGGTRELELAVSGEVVDVTSVAVGAGETRTVRFVRQFATPGRYEVAVGNESTRVVVRSADTADADRPIADSGVALALLAFVAVLLAVVGHRGPGGRW